MRNALTLLLGPIALVAQGPSGSKPDPAKKFFASAPVIQVAITLTPEGRQQLRDEPREYVHATIAIDGDKSGWPDIGVKLKGAAGSFREIDDRPGFTINLKKFDGKETLHGLRRFHLNNGAQDKSCLSEWLGSEVFTAAGYPAPRVAHACVTLDGEYLGLYVLREGFDKQFLMRTLGELNGNLYDGGFCQDIDRSLEKDSGDGPDDYSDLSRLRAACSIANTNDANSSLKLETAIDMKAFIEFMALEAMLGHWDGYCQNRNNFRLWCSTTLGRSQFFPHGMDQLFDKSDASILQHPSAIVASAVQGRSEWRKLYRNRLKALLPLFKARTLTKKIKTRARRIQKVLKKFDREAVRKHEQAVRELVQRVTARYAHLQRQVKEPEPRPMALRVGQPKKIEGWNSAGETSNIALKKRSFGGSPALHITCNARGERAERRGAYRTTVLLAEGKYRFSAMARCEDVEGLPTSNSTNEGGVRVIADGEKSTSLLGDSKWTRLSCEFEVAEFRRNIELRIELRSFQGKVWFRTNSLQLERCDGP